jgi:NTP pyrophosphatase (non-canonical NTP hydrolase)
MKKKLEKIFYHYGEAKQVSKLSEELLELQIELENLGWGKNNEKKDFLSEVADVLVVCSQFAIKYPIIYEIMEQKVDRQIKRMEAE